MNTHTTRIIIALAFVGVASIPTLSQKSDGTNGTIFLGRPDALGDLRDAASFYCEQAGTTLSQSFLAEFEQSIDKLLLTWTIRS